MAAAISITTIRCTAYNVIKTQDVRRITNGDYNLEEYNKVAKYMIPLPRQYLLLNKAKTMGMIGS